MIGRVRKNSIMFKREKSGEGKTRRPRNMGRIVLEDSGKIVRERCVKL